MSSISNISTNKTSKGVHCPVIVHITTNKRAKHLHCPVLATYLPIRQQRVCIVQSLSTYIPIRAKKSLRPFISVRSQQMICISKYRTIYRDHSKGSTLPRLSPYIPVRSQCRVCIAEACSPYTGYQTSDSHAHITFMYMYLQRRGGLGPEGNKPFNG